MTNRKHSRFVTKLFVVFVAFLVIISFVAALFAAQESKPVQETELEKSLPPIQRVMISKLEWGKGGFENILLANFTVKNNNETDIKDITIECIHYAKSDTTLGRSRKTIYDIFPSKKTKTIKRFNMGLINSQTEKISCEIISIVPIK